MERSEDWLRAGEGGGGGEEGEGEGDGGRGERGEGEGFKVRYGRSLGLEGHLHQAKIAVKRGLVRGNPGLLACQVLLCVYAPVYVGDCVYACTFVCVCLTYVYPRACLCMRVCV